MSLTTEQYNVLRLKHTEPPGTGIYNHCFDAGIYTCAGCGEELFDSKSKFDSGCGWPAFNTYLPGKVVEQPDAGEVKDVTKDPIKHPTPRTEIICAKCGGHLGHKFVGETSVDSVRHCVNSVSLKLLRTPTTTTTTPTTSITTPAVESKVPASVSSGASTSVSPLTELLGTKFVGHDGKEVSLVPDKDIVCVYVSSSWCPPCKTFTPILSKWYSELVTKGKSLSIIFASRDNDEKSFKTYFNKMSFPLAFPFDDERIEELMQKFEVQGIPTLLVFDKLGNFISSNARPDVTKLGLAAYDKFENSSGVMSMLRDMSPEKSLELWLATIEAAQAGKTTKAMFEVMKAEATKREDEWIRHGLVTITDEGCMIPK